MTQAAPISKIIRLADRVKSRRAFLGLWSVSPTLAPERPATAPNVVQQRGRAEVQAHCLALRHISCMSCADSCPESALIFQWQTGGMRTPLINTERCNGCAECLPVCPIAALTIVPVLTAVLTEQSDVKEGTLP